ncbi:MAG: DEAD/DEAH box helicase [Candidatus Melainabacteria bacterium HGW-Melainabacteria-1]|nr:MAG: DEAD/DEAH box helicase [Candidatus Melainabacteria bacterium HGW-Melainabacteria-1]
MSVFKRYHPRLQQAIVSRLGWRGLREVQELASQAILDGNNAVVLAPTAGGKTEAAFFPILSQLLTSPETGTQCLYISPIRALLNNQEERLGLYTEMVGMHRFKWHGEAKPKDKQAFLREPCELLMTTPESLEVMLISPSVPARKIFEQLRYVVIDEIHALADCDRGSHLMAVLERLRQLSRCDFQRIGLSATVGNVAEILSWLQGSSGHPGLVITPHRPPSKKQLEVKYLDEVDLANEVGRRAYGKKSLFFTDSRRRAETVSQSLADKNVDIFVHHSSISREERELAEKKVTSGKNVAIVCTSTLELGIDVGELDLIFQAEAPSSVASFLQRMGRTGRREGAIANTTFLTTSSEAMVQAIGLIELAREHWVEDVKLDFSAWHILVHQIMAMCLQSGAVRRSQIWQTLTGASCFKAISEASFHCLLDYLKAEDYLSEESGLLSMGLKAEKTFGRKNFLELYSVFTSPVAYKVLSMGGQLLGSIDWQFADVIELDTCFLLAGKGWIVKRIGHSEKTVWAEKAPQGKAPKWGGFAPMMLSYRLCRKVRDILVSDQEYPYCDAASLKRLFELRQDRYFLANHFAPLQVVDKQMLWWTHAGGRINNTLRYALSHELSCEITSNNYYLKFTGDLLSEKVLKNRLKTMAEPDYWLDQKLISALQHQLPELRLSKYQPCLPKQMQLELVAKEYLDLNQAQTFIERCLKH